MLARKEKHSYGVFDHSFSVLVMRKEIVAMPSRIILSVLLGFWPALAMTQQTIYESEGTAGPVFSDRPASGAKTIPLPPLNVIDAPPVPKPAAQESVAAPVSYSQLAIVSPGDEDTIHTNTGDFDVKLQVEPSLDPAGGDVIVVKLDGKPLPQRFSTAAFHIGESDWSRPFTESVEHSLQVAITNGDGGVLIESVPVKFFMHHATGH